MRHCGVVTETALQESIRKLRQRFTHIITFDTWQRQERQSLMAKGMWPLGACFPTCPWVSNTESWQCPVQSALGPPCTGGPCLQCTCLGLRGGYLCRIACDVGGWMELGHVGLADHMCRDQEGSAWGGVARR